MRERVLTGMVHFSMTILDESAAFLICLCGLFPILQVSRHSGAGTEGFRRYSTVTKMISDSLMPFSTSVSKKRLRPRVPKLGDPGSNPPNNAS